MDDYMTPIEAFSEAAYRHDKKNLCKARVGRKFLFSALGDLQRLPATE